MKKFFALMTFLLLMSAQASAMKLTLCESVGEIGISSKPFELKIKGYTRLDGDYSKGVAVFNDDLYFHFDALALRDKLKFAKTFAEEEAVFDYASRFGGSDFENTVPVFTFEGRTKIYPMSSDDGRAFYLLMTETGGGGSLKLIGERDGIWVKYFDTLDLRKSKQLGWDYYLQNMYTDGNTIIFAYEQEGTEKICELHYKWNEAAQWFDMKKI